MERAGLGRRPHDDLHARVRGVVFPSSFLAVHVSDAVCVALHELVVVHDLAEVRLPEDHSVLDLQPRALEKQAVLQPPPVLELVVLAQIRVQVFHAERHVCVCDLIHLVRSEFVDGLGPAAFREVLADIHLVHVFQERPDAHVYRHALEHARCLCQGAGEIGAEPSDDERHDPRERYKGIPLLEVDVSRSDQPERLLERHAVEHGRSEVCFQHPSQPDQLVAPLGLLVSVQLLVIDPVRRHETSALLFAQLVDSEM